MSKKINVMEFVEGYNKCSTVKARESYLKKLNVKEYVDYEVKIALATKIVNASSFDQERPAVVKVNAPMRYVLFVYTVLSYYTDLDMHSDKMFAEFNMLNKSGLVDEIFKIIPEREVSEFNNVVAMTYEDFLSNYREPHSFIANQIEKLGSLLEYIPQETLERIAETAGKFLNGIDGEQ